MTVTFKKLHPHLAAEVGPIDLRQVHDPGTLAEIRAGMDEYAVLVFRDQPFADKEQLAFAQHLDGELHTKTGSRALKKNRCGNEALGDISNLDENGKIIQGDDRRGMYSLGNRLWHTDASFQDPAGRYSMRSARVIAPAGADTEFADNRAAYDALPDEMKARLAPSTRWSAQYRAPTERLSTWPPTPREPSIGRCPSRVFSCWTSSSMSPNASSSTATSGGWAIW